MSNDMENKLPWERPAVAMILSIFGGKVVSVNTVSTKIINGGNNDDSIER